MALLHVLDTEGRSVLVHSSIFDGMSRKVAQEREGWNDAWARFNQTHPPRPRRPDS